MYETILLAILAVLLYTLGTVAVHSRQAGGLTLLVAPGIYALSALVAAGAAGARPFLWSAPVVGLGYILAVFCFSSIVQRHLLQALAYVLAVALFGIVFSSTQPELIAVAGIALTLAGIGFAIDRVLARRAGQTRVAALALLIVIYAAAEVLKPGTSVNGFRLFINSLSFRQAQAPVSGQNRGESGAENAATQSLDTSNVNHSLTTGSQTIALSENIEPSTPVDGKQWSPYLEWSLENPSFSGNPYDLVATASFVHTESGETRTTEMFYDGDNVWKFRFTGTLTGTWTFSTSSADAELNNHSGTVLIEPNPGVPGFITNFGNKWGYSGTNRAFVPQLVMYGSPEYYYNDPDQVDEDLQVFFTEHGFNGFNTLVFCRWFDIEEPTCGDIDDSDPNPDPRTFEALELLITKVHNRGGVVHIWVWGDESRRQTPRPWGINDDVDQRLQRYIAARLGPIPGWTMGYGFDLDEWVTAEQLETWHDYVHDHLGWSHFLGGRPAGPNSGTDHSAYEDWNEPLDYASYEHHKPGYDVYVAALQIAPDKPAFSEDRFRIRDGGNSKDYSMEETRRGLWHSAMAGGVANIWGNLIDAPGANDGADASAPYPRPEWIKTYDIFFKNRFLKELVRCTEVTGGLCLKHPANTHFIFYTENSSSVTMDLSGLADLNKAVAVDTKLKYAEIDITDELTTTNDLTWEAPYNSDWAIAIGDYDFFENFLPVTYSVGFSPNHPGKVTVVFSEPMDEISATDIANYQISNDIDVVAAALSPDSRTVTLTTSPHAEETSYTLTINKVKAQANPSNVTPANTQLTYTYWRPSPVSWISLPAGAVPIIAAGLALLLGAVLAFAWFFGVRKYYSHDRSYRGEKA